MYKGDHLLFAAICALLFTGVLLIPAVPSGTILQKGSIVPSPTGTLIIHQVKALPQGYPVTYRSGNNQNYNQDATACGNCDTNWDALLYVPIQPHFKHVQTILNRLNQNGEFIYDSACNETSLASGNCGTRGFYSYV